jgi:hypothetical protein
MGHAHPEPEIDNRFLESLEIGTDDSWILERVGIRSRRTVLPLDYIRETRNRDPRAALEVAASDATQKLPGQCYGSSTIQSEYPSDQTTSVGRTPQEAYQRLC